MVRGGSGGRGGRGNAPGGTSGSCSSRANSSAGPHSRRPSAAASKGPPTTPKAGADASSTVSTPTAASAADADAAWAALSADAERVDWAAEPTAIKSAPRPTLPTSVSTPALARVPSPNGSAAPDIASLVGLSLRLTYAHDKAAPPSSIEGLLWCYDAHTGFIALECASSQPSGRDYRLVKLALVRSVQVLQPTPTPNALAVPDALSRPVNIAGIRATEASAVRAEEQRLSRRGPKGTTAWAQAIFDALAKTCERALPRCR